MIFITGSTGHIGNNLARELNRQGKEFRLLVRQVSEAIIPFQNQIIIGDIYDISWMKKVIHRNDTLIHLAANIDIENNNLEDCILVNDFGTKQLIDLAIQKNLYFVYTSSVDIINRNAENKIIHEPDSIELSQSSNYALTKARATKYLLEKMTKNEIRAIIFYPTAVIGPHDYKPSEAGKEILRSLHRHLFINIHGGYNFIDVRDVCLYIIEALNVQMNGSFILGNTPLSIQYLYQKIASFSSIRPRFIFVPKWLAYLGVHLTKKYTKVMLDAVYDNYNYDLQHTLNHFLTRPRPIDDTINDTLIFFNQNKKRLD